MTDIRTLRIIAREAIQAGKLPTRRPERMWGGPGVGACCLLCSKPIEPNEPEVELEYNGGDGGVVIHHLHLECCAAWELELTEFKGIGHAPSMLGTAPGPAGDSRTLPHASPDLMMPGHGGTWSGK
jgi:hypothetical protein